MKIKKLGMFVVLSLALAFSTGLVLADTVYTVQPGDTLSALAVRFGMSVRTIQGANDLLGPGIIVVGQQLTIPDIEDSDAPYLNRVVQVPPPAGVAEAVEGGVLHTVQPNDTLNRLFVVYGVPMAEIQEANELGSSVVIRAGQQLFIPGATLPAFGSAAEAEAAAALIAATLPATQVASAPATQSAPAAATQAPAPAVAAATNLLPNGSFEGDWYFYLYNELQVPTGWKLSVDEGPNTLVPGSGGLFNRPEVRVVSTAALPPAEHSQFISDGFKTVKVFKGGAPTNVSLFTDLFLQPGSYRLSIGFFPDIVAEYLGGVNKVYVSDPLSAEARIIHNNGGTDWQTVNIGQKNTLTYDFTVSQAGAVRVGGSFRNRFETANNGWFLDNWVLTRLN